MATKIGQWHEELTATVGRNGSIVVYCILFLLALKSVKRIYRIFTAPKIKGTTVLITGASQGIGKAAILEFQKHGAKHIIILARSAEKLQEIAEKVNGESSDIVSYFPVDCSDGIQVERVSKEIMDKFGVPDIIVNSAGAGRWRYLWEMPVEEIKECVNAPYLAAAYIARSFLPSMIEKNSGIIVNVQSPAAYTAFGGSTAYLSNRWALRGLSEALRADVDGTNIRVQEAVFGETKSNYFDNNEGSAERIPWIARLGPAITPEYAASKIIQTIKSGDKVATYPPLMAFTKWFSGWAPDLVNFLVRKTGWSLEKAKKAK